MRFGIVVTPAEIYGVRPKTWSLTNRLPSSITTMMTSDSTSGIVETCKSSMKTPKVRPLELPMRFSILMTPAEIHDVRPKTWSSIEM
jgi:hypothetical protein